MKAFSTITCLALSVVTVCPVFGQSSFRMTNLGFSVDAPIFDAAGHPLAGPDYLAELCGGVTPDALGPALAFYSDQRVIVPFMSGSGAGYFRDTYAGRDPADHPTVLGVAPYSESAWLQVRAWDTRLGTTYEEVAALGVGGYGESLVFSASGSNPFDLLSPGAPLIGLESFSLRPVVPEPSAWLLLLLSLPLVWWRNSKPH